MGVRNNSKATIKQTQLLTFFSSPPCDVVFHLDGKGSSKVTKVMTEVLFSRYRKWAAPTLLIYWLCPTSLLANQTSPRVSGRIVRDYFLVWREECFWLAGQSVFCLWLAGVHDSQSALDICVTLLTQEFVANSFLIFIVTIYSM